MTDLSRDELIGAYLDDELSAEDRTRVESLLAESEESRQMLDELRALRSHLQSLPRHTLPADFSQQVLKRAEREMLLGRTTAGEQAATVARDDEARPATIPFGSRWARPLVYAGLAIAAALMISFLLPNQIEQRGDVRLAARDDEEQAPTEKALVADESPQQPMGAPSVAKSAPPAGHDDQSMPAFRGAGGRATPDKQADMPEPAAPAPESGYSAKRGAAANQVLIVDCRVTRGALTSGAFEQVLGEAAISVASEEGIEPDKESDDATVVFYVEATPEELETALAALEKRGKDFPTVEIDPAGDNERQSEWSRRFGRVEDLADRAPAAPAEADAERPRSGEAEDEDQSTSESLRDYVAGFLPATEVTVEQDGQTAAGRSTARRLRLADRREEKPAQDTADPADAGEPAPAEISANAVEKAELRAKRDAPQRVRAVFVLRVADNPPTTETQPSPPERDEQ